MTTPCIITVAITGSVPRREHNPAVPITVDEQIESTQAAWEAGAAIAHVHVRNDDETVSSDPEKFAAYQEGVRRHCPGLIVQFSTGGRARDPDRRGSMLYLRPDMASLSTGSCNFPSMIYENHPELIATLAADMRKYGIKPEIEVFDLSMLFTALEMAERGELETPLHVQFVMGVKNAMPARRDVLEFQVAKLHEAMPGATWTGAAIGRNQLPMNRWALELGGHCRTGMEDNIRYDREHLAASNAELVARVAALCPEYDRHPATCAEARRILALPEPAPAPAA